MAFDVPIVSARPPVIPASAIAEASIFESIASPPTAFSVNLPVTAAIARSASELASANSTLFVVL